MRGVVMKLLVVLWAYGILKVVDPTPSQPLYILYDPTCRPSNGPITVKVSKRIPADPPRRDVVGTLNQGNLRCDVEQLVFAGP
jgi:hypothetical protein